jgi:hypothetical protein
LALDRQSVTLPHIYTLTGTGYTYAAALGAPQERRVRATEEGKKAQNLFFIQHTMAVTDVLISAWLLSQTVPGIMLHRLYLERELKRKIYVEIADRTVCLEPDASVHFFIQRKWQYFIHFGVYRTHLAEWRFKQKIRCYAAYTGSMLHQELFHTPALSIAVFCHDSDLAARLKRWTEEVLQEIQQPELGERFFFTSSNPATASPEELYLSTGWEQAFDTAKTPLLLMEG